MATLKQESIQFATVGASVTLKQPHHLWLAAADTSMGIVRGGVCV